MPVLAVGSAAINVLSLLISQRSLPVSKKKFMLNNRCNPIPRQGCGMVLLDAQLRPFGYSWALGPPKKLAALVLLHRNRGLLHLMAFSCLLLPKKKCLISKNSLCKNLQREFYSLIYFRNAIFAAFTISLITRICCIVQPFSNSSISFLEGSAPLCPSESKSSVRTFKLSAMATKTDRLSLVFPVSMWLICVTETPIRSANCSCEMPCAFLYFRIFCPIK